MRPNLRQRGRHALDERLQSLGSPEAFRPPPRGWVRAIRDAIGMSGTQLAVRLGVRPQSVDALEKSEAAGTIRLETLRRVAEALDCTLVYALVPNTSLDAAVEARARAIAMRDLARIDHTMRLEDQAPPDADRERRIQDHIRDIIRDRDLWGPA
jgi:predicted DNA-binding mobile mystery protein A